MYLVDPADGIPVLTDMPEDRDGEYRKATEQEVAVFNDFWGMYWDRVEAGEVDGTDLDEDVRRIILTKHGMTDRI